MYDAEHFIPRGLNPIYFDLVRLALSLATAARGSDLPGTTAVKILEEMILGYVGAFGTPNHDVSADAGALTPIKPVLVQSKLRKWHHLAEERIKDVTPQIPLGKRYWKLEEDSERALIEALFEEKAIVAKIAGFKGLEKGSKMKVIDAACWMKGCSSLGRLRYPVVLLLVDQTDRHGRPRSTDGDADGVGPDLNNWGDVVGASSRAPGSELRSLLPASPWSPCT